MILIRCTRLALYAAVLGTVFGGSLTALDAQTPGDGSRLSLAGAIELAVEHYPALDAVRFAAVGAEASARGVRAIQLPRFLVSTSASRFQEPMPVTPIHGFTPGATPPFDRDLLQGAASVQYTLFEGFGRGAQIEAAYAEAEAAAFDLTRMSQALSTQVSATFLGILGSAQVLDAQDRRLAALASENQRVQQLLDVGRAADVDLLRIQAALASAEAERVSLAATLENAERMLSRLTGLPLERTQVAALAPVTFRGVSIADRGAVLSRALEANPSVLRAQRRAAAAVARGAVARSDRWPQVDLGANYLGWASPNDSPAGEWNVGVSVTWPLFTGGAIKAQIRRSDAEASSARAQHRLAQTEVAEDVDLAISAVHEAQARVASLEIAVARSEEVARIEQLRLDTGSGVQRDYLEAEAVLFANRAAWVQAQYAEVTARVALARVTGELDTQWLRRNLGGTQ